MFESLIVGQNKHWQGQPLQTGIPRERLQDIAPFLKQRQMVAVTGIRRCGKSVLLRQLMQQLLQKEKKENILFLNVEHPFFDQYRGQVQYLEKAFEEYLSLHNPQGTIFVFLDEIQFFDHWQVFVKAKYESGDIKFFLTGSNSLLLSSEYASLLSGRTIQVQLYPFSFAEYLLARGIKISSAFSLAAQQRRIKKELVEYLSWGGFPEVVLAEDPEVKRELLVTYYQNILLKDIVPRFNVANSREIQELLRYLLSHTGKPCSYAQLGKIIGLSDKTIKEYIYYFKQSYLLFEVNQYFPSLKRQMANQKKVYAGDNGFSQALGFRFSEDRGWFLENMVFLELQRHKKEAYYFKGKKECDFVVREGRKLTTAIQVCYALTAENRQRELAGLQEAQEALKIKEGIILTFDQEEKIGGIQVIPLWKWLLRK